MISAKKCPGNSLRCFASAIAHFMFIHVISSALEKVRILYGARVSENWLWAPLCFHRFVHLGCFPIYSQDSISVILIY